MSAVDIEIEISDSDSFDSRGARVSRWAQESLGTGAGGGSFGEAPRSRSEQESFAIKLPSASQSDTIAP